MSALDDLFDGHYFTEDPHVYIPIDEARKELKDLYSRIVELEAMTTWKPIESAPRDGTEIWLFDQERVQGYWNVFTSWWDSDTHEIIDPTHWMPLPQPPEEK